jgi:hypothetical protein
MKFLPSRLAQALMLLTFIRDMPGLNLGRDTDHPSCGVSWLSSVPPGGYWNSTLKGPTTVFFHIV